MDSSAQILIFILAILSVFGASTMVRFLSLTLVLTGMLAQARAEVVTRNLEYKVEMNPFEGVLVYDNTSTGKHPGVIVAHELGASSTSARSRALQYAKLGYVAFCADFYGKGVTPKDGKEAAVKAGTLGKDRKLIRAKMEAALSAFSKQPQVDPKQIAGVGYGTGGTALLELARTGADLEGVVCLHGDLSCLEPADAKKISASILVIVGSEDPQIPPQQLTAFEEEMRGGGVDWQVLRLGGVAHDFTNPQAGRNIKTGSAHDADADKRAHELVRSFLSETFPAKQPAPAARKEATKPKDIPEKVLKVLAYVDDKGEAMTGYEGGRTFGNFEKVLPQTDDKGRRIKYREWDVNPLKMGVNRGPERLVTGSDGSAWFTEDHYKTFKKIR
jgi:dienelactone hydrolase